MKIIKTISLNIQVLFFFFFVVLQLGVSKTALSSQKRVQHKKGREISAAAVKEREVVTHHKVVIDGHAIYYTAAAGTIILKDKKMKPTASIFYIAYFKDGVKNKDQRPITFAYNGGPGSSSVWLQFGGIGPRRLVLPNAEFEPPPPYQLENNQYSILNKTDLVFIDPVGTGYSHALGKNSPKKFWGVEQDVTSMGVFIQDFLTKFNRWNSPKFILGESYGTTRSAALSYYLQEQGIPLNGVILCSSILNWETAVFYPGNDLPYILYLPSYAAVAWYHHKLNPMPKNLPKFLNRVERFATGEYAEALMDGNTVPRAFERKILKKLARYTAIKASFWKQADLRVNNSEFEKELLHKQGFELGRLDARFTGYARRPFLPFRTYSVMGEAISGAFTTAANMYIKNNLKYNSKRPYDVMSSRAIREWSWKHRIPNQIFGHTGGFLNVAPDLAVAMTRNPHLQLMQNNGYFDLGTPFYATLYTLNHLLLPKPLMSHIHIYNYYSGHMIYLNSQALKLLHHNIDHFISSAAR
jgi:carboxypeptidase C (cathepsin A)